MGSNETLTDIVPGLDLAHIRKTNEHPPRVSIIDLIRVISGVVNPKKTWSDIKKGHPDIMVTESYRFCDDYRLSNQGSKGSPVINASGAISIINVLPGTLAASFRAAWSNIISRYLGGDVTLMEEIDRNREMQAQAENDDPIRVFSRSGEADVGRGLQVINGTIRQQYSLTVQQSSQIISNGLIDTRNPQVYAGIPKQIMLPPHVPGSATIIKFGYTSCSGQRIGAHKDSYGGFEYLNTFHCANAYGAEQRFKDYLKQRGRLITGIRLNGTPDTELFWVISQQEWEQFANEFKRICDEMRAEYCQTERDNIRLRIAEIELEKEREKTKQVEADSKARIAEAQVKRLDRVSESQDIRGMASTNREITEQGGNETEEVIDGSFFSEELADVTDAMPSHRDTADLGSNIQQSRTLTSTIVPRPARRRQPNVPTDVRDYPFQTFIDRYLEPESDMTKGLQWSALKIPFREWHTQEYPNERSNKSLPKAILDYFSSKLGGWHDTKRVGVKVKGFFGWRLRESPLPRPSDVPHIENDTPEPV